MYKLELNIFQGHPGMIATAALLTLVRWKASDQAAAVVDRCWTISLNFERVLSNFWTARHHEHLREARLREDWLSHR